MVNVDQKVSRSAERELTLFKLLCVEPDTLDGLTQVTGWGQEATQHALLRLIVEGKVSCRNGSGKRLYAARTEGSHRPATR